MQRQKVASQMLVAAFLIGGLTLMAPGSAEAVPAFARKHKMSCNTCHTVFPLLNPVGRTYMTNGYRFQPAHEEAGVGEIQPEDRLILEAMFPWSALIESRPFDKKRDRDAKVRAVHEIEFLAAGTASREVSYFFEIEAEDEANFEPEMGTVVLQYQPRPEFGVHVAINTGLLHADPYNSLTERRITRSSKLPLVSGFASDEPVLSNTQQVILTGRAANRVFYLAGLGTGSDDPEGEGRLDYAARLAVDVVPDLALGGFAIYGNRDEGPDDNYVRAGGDFNLSVQNLELYGVLMVASDDVAPDSSETNTGGYAEGAYVIPVGDSDVRVVPAARVEFVTARDGDDTFANLILSPGVYIGANLRIFAEFFTELDKPGGGRKDNRVTLFAQVGF